MSISLKAFTYNEANCTVVNDGIFGPRFTGANTLLVNDGIFGPRFTGANTLLVNDGSRLNTDSIHI